ncbi:hypothetical protein NDU88_006845 [Pleurodeles waltl]|uniref:Uncharacterized protein n=1 Tax=Pleurodeles waltl TaxID=8319 RepID=A0AAV7PM36_PLEWA|nr:hypothetical protein NDU88_006845 [Pleurodeles waltl]
MLIHSTPFSSSDTALGSQQPLQTDIEEASNSDKAPVTRAFLAFLFDTLKTDIQDIKRDPSQDLREVSQDLSLVGERVSYLEDNKSARGKEVDMLQQEIIWYMESAALGPNTKPPDILAGVHDFQTKEDLTKNARAKQPIHFRGHPIGLI